MEVKSKSVFLYYSKDFRKTKDPEKNTTHGGCEQPSIIKSCHTARAVSVITAISDQA